MGSSGGLEPRSLDVRGNAIFLTQCLLLLRPHQSEVTSSLRHLSTKSLHSLTIYGASALCQPLEVLEMHQ